VPYGATPIDENIVTTQQGVADMFYRAKLIPKAVTVKDNVWRDQDALTAR
jgi:sulfonate transport system substrate-binding protein